MSPAGAAPELVQAEMAGVEGRQRVGFRAEHGEVTNSVHRRHVHLRYGASDNAVLASAPGKRVQAVNQA